MLSHALSCNQQKRTQLPQPCQRVGVDDARVFVKGRQPCTPRGCASAGSRPTAREPQLWNQWQWWRKSHSGCRAWRSSSNPKADGWWRFAAWTWSTAAAGQRTAATAGNWAAGVHGTAAIAKPPGSIHGVPVWGGAPGQGGDGKPWTGWSASPDCACPAPGHADWPG